MKHTTKIIIVIVLIFSGASFGGTYGGGSGTEAQPYQIGDITNWQELMTTSADWYKYFIMTADVNLSGITLTPIGNYTTQFRGIFDGNDHIISNAVINQPGSDYIGLFGYLSGGQIKNLGIEDANITGSIYVGGLVGYTSRSSWNPFTDSTISNCYSTGSVSASSYAGGLVGDSSGSTISNCYAISNVTVNSHYGSSAYAGGLVGYMQSFSSVSNCYAIGSVSSYSPSSSFYDPTYAGGLVGLSDNSTISNCYSTGSVVSTSTSYSYVGGLVGNLSGRISNCYSTGSVSLASTSYSYAGGLVGKNSGSSFNACLWDTQTSGQSVGVGYGTSWGVVGKTTAEMKMLSTFTIASWHISDVNGSETVWIMLPDGQDYPKITYFFYSDCFDTVPLPGNGTQQDPYQIWSPEDFVNLSRCGSAWDKNIILMDDLDMNGFTVHPIGNSIIKFTGSFNGQGFVIRNAVINLPNKHNVGLFGCIGTSGVITDLSIEDVNVVGKRCIGGLIGSNRGVIFNCYITGSATANSSSCIGGLVGLNFNGTISNSHSIVNVNGSGATIGGLVGYNGKSGVISNCYAAGEVANTNPNDFDSFTGGLIGSNFGIVSRCYATANVYATSSTAYIRVSGLVGDNVGTISNCYATGNVQAISTSSANICAGGLVGVNSFGDVNDSYATEQVAFSCGTGSSYFVGGLIGLNYESSVNRCYSKGAVNSSESAEADCCVGGFAGLNMGGLVSGCFWDIQASGKTISAGGRGLTTEQMKTMLIYQNMGWADNGWVIDDGMDYPRLEWENAGGVPIPAPGVVPLLGSGTGADPYQVWTAADFALLSWYCSVLDKHVVLMADVDLAGVRVCPIGEFGAFTGTFNGNGHTVRNVQIYEPTNSYVGVFSRVGASGMIKNLCVRDVNVVGGDFVGGLIGKNEGGAVNNCYSTGTIDGFSYTGGLIGSNDGGTMNNCYSATIVTVWDANSFYSYAGGLVGYNNSGTIRDCYATGAVSGDSGDGVGGLVGSNDGGTISNCYSTGSVTGTSSSAGGLMVYFINGGTGGLVGNLSSGTISNCYSTGSVSSSSSYHSSYAGGLVGNLGSGTISNCYSTGSVSSSSSSSYPSYSYAGGLVGRKYYSSVAKIERCYSTGTVSATGNYFYKGGLLGYSYPFGNVTASFWDKETSGLDTSADGTGKTTAEMQTLFTFTSTGWDFIDETVNGPNDIWRMCVDGVDYPHFSWEYSSYGDFGCPDGTDLNDLIIFIDQWLLEELSYDFYQNDEKYIVNFFDWNVFADSWDGDKTQLADFTVEWLKQGAYCADIAPAPGGDGIVNIIDFAVFADNWLEGL